MAGSEEPPRSAVEPGFPPGPARGPVDKGNSMTTNHKTRRGLRALVLAGAVALCIAIAAPADAYVRKPPPGKLGASWMANQIDANDGYLTSFGSPDPVNTAYAVIRLQAA